MRFHDVQSVITDFRKRRIEFFRRKGALRLLSSDAFHDIGELYSCPRSLAGKFVPFPHPKSSEESSTEVPMVSGPGEVEARVPRRSAKWMVSEATAPQSMFLRNVGLRNVEVVDLTSRLLTKNLSSIRPFDEPAGSMAQDLCANVHLVRKETRDSTRLSKRRWNTT